MTHAEPAGSKFLVETTTSEARSRNRRVEIGIVDTIIDYQGVARNQQP